MTYYEELGVSPSASIGEIRQAYKVLARLLHPDQCTDERLRGLAEIQMKRLNQMLQVLADPEERRRYDTVLSQNPEPALVPEEGGAYPFSQHGCRLGRAAWPWIATRPTTA